MHIHLPKPLHGWREFVGEVGIIVIGILIALGGEQVVEKIHHRSQVREMTEKLRAESIGSRQVIEFDTTVLRRALVEVEDDITALDSCGSALSTRLQPLTGPRYLLPKNAAWMGLCDSALLALMPGELAGNYWVLDVSQSFLRSDVEQANNAFAQAVGAVESVRRGAPDRQVCNEARLSLERLNRAQLGLLQRTGLNRDLNEQALRGERIGLARDALGQDRGAAGSPTAQ